MLLGSEIMGIMLQINLCMQTSSVTLKKRSELKDPFESGNYRSGVVFSIRI